MNNSTYKLIVTILVLVILIGGAVLLYRNLSGSVDIAEAIPTETISENLAPEFTVTDGEGNAVKLSDFRGKGVVLNFWASWCGPCKSEMPHFQAAYEEYGDELHFLMVNMSDPFGDPRADSDAFLTEGGYSFPVYYDTGAECAYGYGVTGIPMTFFIDAEGHIVSGKSGMISQADLERRILTILD
ncbi:MAG: TlpA family protein disulfide reductase [Ruminococcaceae bacterium]|nr:TlpA family protein disulfide reductase [Oscillospiraceae bacterium]